MIIKKSDILLLCMTPPACSAVILGMYYGFGVWLANFFMCGWGGICT